MPIAALPAQAPAGPPCRRPFAPANITPFAAAMPGSVASVARSATGSRKNSLGKPKTQDAAGSGQTAMSRLIEENIEKILEILRAEPEKVFPCYEMLRTSTFGVSKDDEEDEDDDCEQPLHSSYTKLHRLPKDFVKAYVQEKNADYTLDILNRLEKHNPGSVRHLFFHAHGVAGGTSWPKFAHDRSVFRAAFGSVHESLGSRLSSLKTVEEDGKISVDWNNWGGYKLYPEEKPEKTHVKHVKSGKEAALDHPENGNYRLLENWDECKAKVQHQRTTTPLIDFFGAAFKLECEKRAKSTETIQNAANQVEANRLQLKQVAGTNSSSAEDNAAETSEDEKPSKRAKITEKRGAPARQEPKRPDTQRRKTITAREGGAGRISQPSCVLRLHWGAILIAASHIGEALSSPAAHAVQSTSHFEASRVGGLPPSSAMSRAAWVRSGRVIISSMCLLAVPKPANPTFMGVIHESPCLFYMVIGVLRLLFRSRRGTCLVYR